MVMVGFAILGAIDDWEGIRGPRRGSGMRIRTKFLLQTILALGAALSLRYLLNVPQLHWPRAQHPLDLGIWYVPVAMFIIVAMSNAVNFTDGMDGLAGLISATCFAAYGVISLQAGQVYIARFCFTLVGAIFGFLWFNVHPAQLFMGDTGSLAIGATLAYVALMTGQWLALPLIAIIPVSEAVSDVLQIAYFKITGGKRLFKMAPLHLHFELLGLERDTGRPTILVGEFNVRHDRYCIHDGVNMSNWNGKRVLIMGAARQGQALTRFLCSRGAIVILNDKQLEEKLSSAKAALKDLNIRWITGGHPLEAH